jgi:hypothetical protein
MRRILAVAAVASFIALLVVACSSSSTGSGNPAGCPATQPASGEACAASGLACSYGCNVSTSCDGQHWTVTALGIACPQDAGSNGDGPRACHSNADCGSLLSCSPGGQPSGCGVCIAPPNPCNVDSDCQVINDAAATQPMVCGPGGPCTCGVGGKTGSCIPACHVATDCAADEACGASGHCVAKPCTTDADCPSTSSLDYACSAAKTCAPKSCTTDADCGAHFCVNNTCYPQPGSCVPPAA